ncbi:hypothetical protein Poly24_27280 [Rosistilla carotiformis]|uniref:Uncharacterized protein n=1 Tax=Rosistilla carotiformis TaxID=2528017 RepID=A0A518JTY8_9BACT|nr:hypothetical protein [Rosistilla carotiformis]QDV69014.1 hypothetical protein Poly24_27280 [Rosistilla carotiformis]
MFKEDKQSQAERTNRNILNFVLTTRQYVDQINDIMKAEFASLGLSPRIRLEDYGQRQKAFREAHRAFSEQRGRKGMPW